MTRDDFKLFFNAVERSPTIRNEIRECQNKQDLIEIASKYGFSLTVTDFNFEEIENQMKDWFEISQISPIKG